MGTHPIFESDFDCLTEKQKMGDYNYNADDYYDEVYDRSQLALDRMFSPREEPFDFSSSLGAYLNFNLLNDKIQNREPSIFEELLSGDEDHELEEEYETDPNQKIITFFRFSFPQSPTDEMTTTTSSPFDPPKFFTIVKFTFNRDTSDYDHEQSESEWGLGGDFDEDRQQSSFDMASQNGEPWWGTGEPRLKYDDYDYIDGNSDMMVAHFPLHYILVCFGFSLMIALLFMTRRRQIARQRQRMMTMGQATTDVKIVIGNDLVKCDAPPAYDDAIKLPKEKEDEVMLPKYTEK